MKPLEIGRVHAVRYPFYRTTYQRFVGCGPTESVELIESWRPGCDSDGQEDQSEGSDDRYWFSDGHGEMLLEVVAEFKPGRFPARVFFTRKWKDPDGKVFGLPKLRMTTRTNFLKLLKGYRREYTPEYE